MSEFCVCNREQTVILELKRVDTLRNCIMEALKLQKSFHLSLQCKISKKNRYANTSSGEFLSSHWEKQPTKRVE